MLLGDLSPDAEWLRDGEEIPLNDQKTFSTPSD
jgi:hypothetical protein